MGVGLVGVVLWVWPSGCNLVDGCGRLWSSWCGLVGVA